MNTIDDASKGLALIMKKTGATHWVEEWLGDFVIYSTGKRGVPEKIHRVPLKNIKQVESDLETSTPSFRWVYEDIIELDKIPTLLK